MNITYRQLAEYECERIKEIDASTFVKRAWRDVCGVKQWVDLNWQDDDFPEGYENHLAALKRTFESNGFAIGAFDGEQLIGFCSVNRDVFGNQYKYVLLDQLFISKDYKRNGIGKKLFFLSVDKAKLWGVDKFYICAGSSEDTLAFYISLGCEDAKEINHELYNNDINDIQLEYDFSTMKLPIKAQRLYIIKLYETMAESVHLASLDEDNRRFVPDEVFETVAEAKDVIASLISYYSISGAPIVYAVILNNGQHIGHVQAVPLPEDGWEIGYHIAKPFTGYGYATEAVKAFLPVIMSHLNIAQIYGITLADNIASRAVLEKCGFSLEYDGMGQYQGNERSICRYIYTENQGGCYGTYALLSDIGDRPYYPL